MKFKAVFIHLLSITILVAVVYTPIRLSYIQNQKLIQVVHTVKLQEDSLLQNIDTSIEDKLKLLSSIEHADSNIIIANRKLLGQPANSKYVIASPETTEKPYEQKLASILLDSLDKLYQSSVISKLEFTDELILLEATLSIITEQTDGKSVSFYSILARCYPFRIFIIIDTNSHLIYELHISSDEKYLLFSDIYITINSWFKYLDIPFKSNEFINSYNTLETYDDTERIVSYMDNNRYQIANTDISYIFSYTNIKNAISIRLDYTNDAYMMEKR